MPWHPDMARIVKAVEAAPSIFNQRPWDVQLSDDRDRVELYADPGRTAGKFWLLPGLDGQSPLLDHLQSGRVMLASVEVMPVPRRRRT